MLIVLGVAAALALGALALLLVGEVAAVAAGLIVVVVVIFFGVRGSGPTRRFATIVLGTLTIGSVALGAWIGVGLVSALSDTSGRTDEAEPAHLAAAEEKLEETGDDAGFRFELTETELTAVVQDGLPDDGPVRRIAINLVAGEDGNAQDGGRADFVAEFKSESLTARGTTRARADAGGIRLELIDVDFGAIASSAVARAAIEEVLNSVIGFNDALAEGHLSVQSVAIEDDRVIITGTSASGDVITSANLLESLADEAADQGQMAPPPEALGPGDVNALEAPGAFMYLALGDSLAANVGVEQPRDGYVSRFHRQLLLRGAVDLGLRNLGVPGETSGSFILGGQLEAALSIIRSTEVGYVTIDIGANDLLGHLGSDDCANRPTGAQCQARLEDTYASYEANLDHILRGLREEAPDATLIFLQAYNPFSLGPRSTVLGERATDRAISDLNEIAARVAMAHGALVADGFSPMSNTTAATTHILDQPPDIHPRAIGYDILASALLDALLDALEAEGSPGLGAISAPTRIAANGTSMSA